MTIYPQTTPAATESFHLRIPVELWKRINQLARQEHRTTSNMVRVLLQESLAQRERKGA